MLERRPQGSPLVIPTAPASTMNVCILPSFAVAFLFAEKLHLDDTRLLFYSAASSNYN